MPIAVGYLAVGRDRNGCHWRSRRYPLSEDGIVVLVQEFESRKDRKVDMSATPQLERGIAAALLSVGVAVAGFAIAECTAQALPHFVGAQAIPRCRPAIFV